jgi:hypothetical protein
MRRNKELEFMYQRLDEVRLSERERIRARAQLERAEAVASLIVDGGKAIERLFRKLVVRPIRRLAHAG